MQGIVVVLPVFNSLSLSFLQFCFLHREIPRNTGQLDIEGQNPQIFEL
jgi:hypothetical protein